MAEPQVSEASSESTSAPARRLANPLGIALNNLGRRRPLLGALIQAVLFTVLFCGVLALRWHGDRGSDLLRAAIVSFGVFFVGMFHVPPLESPSGQDGWPQTTSQCAEAPALAQFAGLGCHSAAHAWHDRPASRRMGSPADPPSGALAAHCHDRNRSFDHLSPCLAALVRT